MCAFHRTLHDTQAHIAKTGSITLKSLILGGIHRLNKPVWLQQRYVGKSPVSVSPKAKTADTTRFNFTQVIIYIYIFVMYLNIKLPGLQ